MIRTATALAALFALAAGSAGADETTNKVVIGEKKPAFKACYRNAADGGADYGLVEPCDRSMETEPLSQRDQAILYVNRGVIYYNLGDYEQAVADFSAALDLDIHVKAKTLVNRGLSYEALGAERLARLDYAAALAYNPDNPTARRRLEELDKPVYDRARVPSRINAGPVIHGAVGI